MVTKDNLFPEKKIICNYFAIQCRTNYLLKQKIHFQNAAVFIVYFIIQPRLPSKSASSWWMEILSTIFWKQAH